MSTIIYLSNQTMQFVVGTPGVKKVEVKEFFEVQAPEGSVINGIFMDTEAFVGFLKNLWKERKLPNKDVYLVVNSTKFIGRAVDLPNLNDAKTFEYIQREFADMEQAENSIFAYVPLPSEDKNLRRVYAEGIEPDYLKEYVEVFEEAGVTLKGIVSGEGSIITLADHTIGQAHRTFVLQIAGKMTLTTILWVNGTFSYYNSVRCFHEKGSEDYAIDLARSVSQIKQFMMAHQIEYPLECIVLAGIDDAYYSTCLEALMMQGIQENIESFSKQCGPAIAFNGDAGESIFAISGLFNGGKNQNYLNRYKKTTKKSKLPKVGKSGKIIFATAAVMLIALGITFAIHSQKKAELKKLTDYNESLDVIFGVAEYNAYLSRNSFLVEQHNAIKNVDENLDTYPIGSKKIEQIIEKCALGYATVEMKSFDADAGVVNFTAKAEDVEKINQFITRLLGQEVFNDIDYTGYNYNAGEELWDINMICTLSEAAGK